jgi:DNA-directed RNA polymerase specialized sigma24 family protein
VTSFDDFVRENQHALMRYAVLLSGTHTDAEDLVQEVLTRIYPRWERLLATEGSLYAHVRRAVTGPVRR